MSLHDANGAAPHDIEDRVGHVEARVDALIDDTRTILREVRYRWQDHQLECDSAAS